MSDSVRSMLLGPSALWLVAVVALFLTVTRRPRADREALDRISTIFLLGISWQCMHLLEEYLTGFQTRLPQFLGLVPWSHQFFMTLNVCWIAVWAASAAGIRANVRVAFFPAWFFAIGMIGNAIWHPLLSIATGGYFAGLFTSPFGAIAGVMMVRRLAAVTEAMSAPGEG